MTAAAPGPPSRTPLGLDVLARQADRLARDLAERTAPVDRAAAEALHRLGGSAPTRVFVVGDGDSHHAALAAEMAFATYGGVPCEPLSAQRFLHYRVDAVPEGDPGALVIGVSASGRTERVVQSIRRASARGLRTLALTSRRDGPLGQAARGCLAVPLDDAERSPGIRTHQASLLGLLLIAGHLGARGGRSAGELLGLRIASLAAAVRRTEEEVRGPARALGASLAGSPVMGVLGSGPNEGTARYCAAKIVECAGVLAFGQDLEEWWHVERFAAPLDMPLLVLAPPGRSQERAAEVATGAAALGRRVIALAPHGDPLADAAGITHLAVAGPAPEELTPLLYPLFAPHLATGMAAALGARPFQGHRPSGPALAAEPARTKAPEAAGRPGPAAETAPRPVSGGTPDGEAGA